MGRRASQMSQRRFFQQLVAQWPGRASGRQDFARAAMATPNHNDLESIWASARERYVGRYTITAEAPVISTSPSLAWALAIPNHGERSSPRQKRYFEFLPTYSTAAAKAYISSRSP
jgi:hypothetical protein